MNVLTSSAPAKSVFYQPLTPEIEVSNDGQIDGFISLPTNITDTNVKKRIFEKVKHQFVKDINTLKELAAFYIGDQHHDNIDVFREEMARLTVSDYISEPDSCDAIRYQIHQVSRKISAYKQHHEQVDNLNDGKANANPAITASISRDAVALILDECLTDIDLCRPALLARFSQASVSLATVCGNLGARLLSIRQELLRDLITGFLVRKQKQEVISMSAIMQIHWYNSLLNFSSEQFGLPSVEDIFANRYFPVDLLNEFHSSAVLVISEHRINQRLAGQLHEKLVSCLNNKGLSHWLTKPIGNTEITCDKLTALDEMVLEPANQLCNPAEARRLNLHSLMEETDDCDVYDISRCKEKLQAWVAGTLTTATPTVLSTIESVREVVGQNLPQIASERRRLAGSGSLRKISQPAGSSRRTQKKSATEQPDEPQSSTVEGKIGKINLVVSVDDLCEKLQSLSLSGTNSTIKVISAPQSGDSRKKRAVKKHFMIGSIGDIFFWVFKSSEPSVKGAACQFLRNNHISLQLQHLASLDFATWDKKTYIPLVTQAMEQTHNPEDIARFFNNKATETQLKQAHPILVEMINNLLTDKVLRCPSVTEQKKQASDQSDGPDTVEDKRGNPDGNTPDAVLAEQFQYSRVPRENSTNNINSADSPHGRTGLTTTDKTLPVNNEPLCASFREVLVTSICDYFSCSETGQKKQLTKSSGSWFINTPLLEPVLQELKTRLFDLDNFLTSLTIEQVSDFSEQSIGDFLGFYQCELLFKIAWKNEQCGVLARLFLSGKLNHRIHHVNGYDETPLMLAAKKGYVNWVQYLLDCDGIEINKKNNSGSTALMYAARYGHYECVKLLCEFPDTINEKSKHGSTALMFAASCGYVECVKILCEFSDMINEKNNAGWTALLCAASYGHVECVKLLCEFSDTINEKSNGGWTALIFATSFGYVECVKILCEFSDTINEKSKTGNTALMFAASCGQVECVEILLTNKYIQTTKKNKSGRTALTEADRGGHTECVRLLFEHDKNSGSSLPSQIKTECPDEFDQLTGLNPHVEEGLMNNLNDIKLEHGDRISNMDFKNVVITMFRFTNETFINCYFSDRNLSNLNFAQCTFINCQFTDSIMTFDNIKDARFSFTQDSDSSIDKSNQSRKVLYDACKMSVPSDDTSRVLSTFINYERLGLHKLPVSEIYESDLLNLSLLVKTYHFPDATIMQMLKAAIRISNQSEILSLIRDPDSGRSLLIHNEGMLRGRTITNFDGVYFPSGTDFRNINLTDYLFAGAYFEHPVLYVGQLLLTDWTGAKMEGGNLFLQDGSELVPARCWSHYTEVARVLAKIRVDLDNTCFFTPLCIAAKSGNVDVVKALISAGVDLNKGTAHHGFTPLFLADREGHTDVVQVLLNAGAHPLAGMNN